MNRTLIAFGTALFIALSLSASAEETPSQQTAEELLGLMNVQENMNKMFEMIKQAQISQFRQMAEREKGLSADAKPIVDEYIGELMDLIAKKMSWDSMKDDFIRIYAETFTEDELKGIIDFYKSSAGQKLLEKTPELMQKSMQISQKKVYDFMPDIEELAKKMAQKIKEKKNAPQEPAAEENP